MYRLSLDDKIRAANKLGLSYGYYVALVYEPGQKGVAPPASITKKQRGPKRRFTDEQAFDLWQHGLNDTAIGKELGVTQQSIYHWRSQLGLPLLSKNRINPHKYRLSKLPDGSSIIIEIDEI